MIHRTKGLRSSSGNCMKGQDSAIDVKAIARASSRVDSALLFTSLYNNKK